MLQVLKVAFFRVAVNLNLNFLHHIYTCFPFLLFLTAFLISLRDRNPSYLFPHDLQDENAAFVYGLEEAYGPFAIDGHTGWLSVKDSSLLDRETTPMVRMTVSAREAKPNVMEKEGKTRATIEVHLLDANDNSPIFLPNNVYSFNITRDASVGTIIGQVGVHRIGVDTCVKEFLGSGDLPAGKLLRHRESNESRCKICDTFFCDRKLPALSCRRCQVLDISVLYWGTSFSIIQDLHFKKGPGTNLL